VKINVDDWWNDIERGKETWSDIGLYSTVHSWTNLSLTLGLRGDQRFILSKYYIRTSPYGAVNTCALDYENQSVNAV
jgi:hypothetical protein